MFITEDTVEWCLCYEHQNYFMVESYGIKGTLNFIFFYLFMSKVCFLSWLKFILKYKYSFVFNTFLKNYIHNQGHQMQNVT